MVNFMNAWYYNPDFRSAIIERLYLLILALICLAQMRVLKKGTGCSYLPGYNKLSEERIQQYDIKKASKIQMGFHCLFMFLCILVFVLSLLLPVTNQLHTIYLITLILAGCLIGSPLALHLSKISNDVSND